jgi:hypothetical protein
VAATIIQYGACLFQLGSETPWGQVRGQSHPLVISTKRSITDDGGRVGPCFRSCLPHAKFYRSREVHAQSLPAGDRVQEFARSGGARFVSAQKLRACTDPKWAMKLPCGSDIEALLSLRWRYPIARAVRRSRDLPGGKSGDNIRFIGVLHTSNPHTCMLCVSDNCSLREHLFGILPSIW